MTLQSPEVMGVFVGCFIGSMISTTIMTTIMMKFINTNGIFEEADSNSAIDKILSPFGIKTKQTSERTKLKLSNV
jgi:hypothetical protein